jgi:hypothetical protein
MIVITLVSVINYPQDDILPNKSKDIPWWLKIFNWNGKIFFKAKIN